MWANIVFAYFLIKHPGWTLGTLLVLLFVLSEPWAWNWMDSGQPLTPTASQRHDAEVVQWNLTQERDASMRAIAAEAARRAREAALRKK